MTKPISKTKPSSGIKSQKRYVTRKVWRKAHYKQNPDGSKSYVPGHWTTVREVYYVGADDTKYIMDTDTGHFRGRVP